MYQGWSGLSVYKHYPNKYKAKVNYNYVWFGRNIPCIESRLSNYAETDKLMLNMLTLISDKFISKIIVYIKILMIVRLFDQKCEMWKCGCPSLINCHWQARFGCELRNFAWVHNKELY